MTATVFHTIIFLVILLLQQPQFIAGCGYGAQQVPKVCQTMTPNHGVPGQTTPIPYSFTVDQVKVKPGEEVVLTIRGAGGEAFKGFLIQGRMKRSGNLLSPIPAGSFKPLNTSKDCKPLNCNGNQASTVTHSHPREKMEYSVIWVAPETVGSYQLL